MDPTSPDVHLGHAVVLAKLRQFQDFGHTVILIIGDFTSLIGDPTGRSKTRPALIPEEIASNAATYVAQVSKILDPEKLEIRYNSQWLNQLKSHDWIKLCAKVTVARITEREDFAHRLKNHIPVSLHELLYPVVQGYDSVALQADIELGGTDQTFNLLMGRYLQEQFEQEAQVIMTMPLLEGLDGIQKMSKSYGNYIGITEAPDQAYGKLMSISDTLMWRYYELLLHYKEEEIKALQNLIAEQMRHPMTIKKEMAHAIIKRFWSASDADYAQEQFTRLFSNKDYTAAHDFKLPKRDSNQIGLIELLRIIEAAKSNSEASRLINSGAVTIEGKKQTDFKTIIELTDGMIIKVGKHIFYKLIL
jgi:tyrosyl-tRNA synthetase